MRSLVSIGLLILGLVGGARAAGAQARDTTVRGVMAARPDTIPARAFTIRMEAGASLPHQLYGSPDVEIAARFGGVARAAIGYRWNWGLSTFAQIGGSMTSVKQREGGLQTDEGWASQYDVMAGLSWQPPIRERSPEPVTLHVAGGGAWVYGPEEMEPFARMEENTPPVPVWEVGISVRPTRRALSATAALQMTRVLPTATDEDVWAQRLIVAIRLGT